MKRTKEMDELNGKVVAADAHFKEYFAKLRIEAETQVTKASQNIVKTHQRLETAMEQDRRNVDKTDTEVLKLLSSRLTAQTDVQKRYNRHQSSDRTRPQTRMDLPDRRCPPHDSQHYEEKTVT